MAPSDICRSYGKIALAGVLVVAPQLLGCNTKPECDCRCDETRAAIFDTVNPGKDSDDAGDNDEKEKKLSRQRIH
ncbi:MAG: hypothetical protein AAB606_00375 [Patescibacteria group bacterium]